MKKEAVQPEGVWQPLGKYSIAVKAAGDAWLFLSGVTPRNERGEVVGRGDIRAQARKVFENMKAVLRGAGSDFHQIVKATTYVRDVGDYSVIQEVRAEYLTEPFPASTMVEVRRLSSDDILIEVEAIAVL